MRWVASMLLLGQLAAAEPPAIARPDGGVLLYDLGATSPWMPLLWDRCTLTLPAGTTRTQLIARLSRATGFASDDSDLLALRDGHRVTIASGTCTVAGLTGTWNGVCIGSVGLIATIDQVISAADLLLLCRQLHYANLGGERTLVRRRIELTIRAFAGGVWSDSLPLAIDVDPVPADQPPKLRFDAQTIPQGGAIDWRPLGWYDGRQSDAQLRWRLQALPAFCTVTGLGAGGRSEQGAALTAADCSLDWFAAAQLQLQAAATVGSGIGSIQAGDGVAVAVAAFDVSVVPASGELEILGDIPFALRRLAQVRLRASRPDVRFTACRSHPGSGQDADIQPPFTAHIGNGDILLFFDQIPAGADVLDGCAVFEAGNSTFRLPYRIAVQPGVAN